MQGSVSQTSASGLQVFLEDARLNLALSMSNLQARGLEFFPQKDCPHHGPSPPWVTASTRELFRLVDTHAQSTVASTDTTKRQISTRPSLHASAPCHPLISSSMPDTLVSQLLQIFQQAGAQLHTSVDAATGKSQAAQSQHNPQEDCVSASQRGPFKSPTRPRDSNLAAQKQQQQPITLASIPPPAFASTLEALLLARSAAQQQPAATAASHYSTLVSTSKNVKAYAQGPDVMLYQQRQQSMEDMKAQEETTRAARKKRTFLQHEEVNLDLPLSQRRTEPPPPLQPREHILHTRPVKSKKAIAAALASSLAAAAVPAAEVAARAAALVAAEAVLMDFGPSKGFQRTAPAQMRAAHKLSGQRACSPPIDLTDVVDMLDDSDDEDLPENALHATQPPSSLTPIVTGIFAEKALAPDAPPPPAPAATDAPLYTAAAAAEGLSPSKRQADATCTQSVPTTNKGGAAPPDATATSASIPAPAVVPLMRGSAVAPTRMQGRLGKMGESGLSAFTSSLPLSTKSTSVLPPPLRSPAPFHWTMPGPKPTHQPTNAAAATAAATGAAADHSRPASRDALQHKKQHCSPAADINISSSQSHPSQHTAAQVPSSVAAVLEAAAAVAAAKAAISAAAVAAVLAFQDSGIAAPHHATSHSQQPSATTAPAETLDVDMDDATAANLQSHYNSWYEEVLSDPLGGSEDTQSHSTLDAKNKEDADNEVKTAPTKRRFKPTPGVRRGSAPGAADHAGPGEFTSAAAEGGATAAPVPEAGGPLPHSTAEEGSGAAGEGVFPGSREISISMEQQEWEKRDQVISAQRAEVQAQREVAKNARMTTALLDQLQEKQRQKLDGSTSAVVEKEETWQEVSARKMAARQAETAQRVQARLDSYTAQQSAASALSAAKEETRTRVRLQLETRHRASLKEVDLRKFLVELKIPVAPMSTMAAKGAASAASESLRRSLKTAKIKFHPDKVPVGSSVYEIVRAEEISKILNAWDMRRV